VKKETPLKQENQTCLAEYVWKFFDNQFVLAAFHVTYSFGFEHWFQHTKHRLRWPENSSVCFFIICHANVFFTDKGYGTVAAFTVVGWIKGSGQHCLI